MIRLMVLRECCGINLAAIATGLQVLVNHLFSKVGAPGPPASRLFLRVILVVFEVDRSGDDGKS